MFERLKRVQKKEKGFTLIEFKMNGEREDGGLAVMSGIILNLDGQGNVNRVQIIRAHRVQINVPG
jgi:hypothetical protein